MSIQPNWMPDACRQENLSHSHFRTAGRARLPFWSLGLLLFLAGAAAAQNSPPNGPYLNINDYGGSTSNADNSTAFNAALADCKAGDGGIILFGKGNYTFTQGVTIDGAGCSVQGAGQRATNLIFNASSGNFITMAEYGNTVSDLGFYSKITSGTPVWTSGYALAVGATSMGASYGIFRDLYFEGVPGAVYVYNSSETRFENLYIVNPTNTIAVRCDDGLGATPKPVYGVRMQNIVVGYNNANNTGTDSFWIGRGCNTVAISNSAVVGGTSAENPSGKHCIHVKDGTQFVVLNDFECVFSKEGAFFEGGSVIRSVNGVYSSTTADNGVAFSTNFTGNAQFTNNDIRDNAYHGMLINGGKDVVVSGGVIGNNSQISAGSYHGITVHKNLSNFTITGVRSGTITQSGGTPSPTQGYGILVNGGGTADYYVIVGNNLEGNMIGGLGDSVGSTHKVVAKNYPEPLSSLVVLNNSAPANTTFSISRNGTYLVQFAGSARSTTDNMTIGANLAIDSLVLATAKVWANEKESHRALVPAAVVVYLTSGSHLASISPSTANSLIDGNDAFTLTLTKID